MRLAAEREGSSLAMWHIRVPERPGSMRIDADWHLSNAAPARLDELCDAQQQMGELIAVTTA